MTFLVDFIIAFTLAALLIPIILRVAHKRELFDRVDARKIHTGSIPRLGGIGMFWGFLMAVLATVILARLRHGEAFPGGRFWILLAAGSGFHALGLVDDMKPLGGRIKLLAQVALASLMVAAGYYFKALELPGLLGRVELGWFGPFIGILWIVGIANAVNLLDGMDGMAGGVSFIGLGIWAAYYLKSGQYLPTIVAIAGAGAALGFLFFNFPPANIFMGDSGSLFLGFLLASMPLLGKMEAQPAIGLLAGITICLLPVLDTLAAIMRRWRWKVSFFTPDKYHLHHKLLDLGFSNRQILAYIYSACAILGATVLASVYVDERLGTLLMLGSWFLGGLLFIVLHFIKEKNERQRLMPSGGSENIE